MEETTRLEKAARIRKWNAAKRKAVKNCCELCGKQVDEFCNSHSVPKMILREIQDQGWVLNAQSVIGWEKLDIKDRINNSGTFHLICKECDNSYFKTYENKEKLFNKPTDLVMAEIALKNSLYQLEDTRTEIEYYHIMQRKAPDDRFIPARLNVLDYDLRTFSENTAFYQQLIDSKDTGGFQVLYWNLLPYKVPIAAQTHVPLGNDMLGGMVNDNYDYNTELTQSMHIAIYPTQKQSVVLAFYHKRDRNYRKLRHQFNTVPSVRRLQFLNYILFQYTSNYYFSKSVEKIIDENSELKKLGREDNGTPNLGSGIRTWEDLKIARALYKPPRIETIPNFLSPELAL